MGDVYICIQSKSILMHKIAVFKDVIEQYSTKLIQNNIRTIYNKILMVKFSVSPTYRSFCFHVMILFQGYEALVYSHSKYNYLHLFPTFLSGYMQVTKLFHFLFECSLKARYESSTNR